MPIPKKTREKLAKLKRMESCEACGSKRDIEWNHSLIYSGRQLQEEYAIRALCQLCHRGNNGTIERGADIISKLNAITEGPKDLQVKYPKCNWYNEKRRYQEELATYINYHKL